MEIQPHQLCWVARRSGQDSTPGRDIGGKDLGGGDSGVAGTGSLAQSRLAAYIVWHHEPGKTPPSARRRGTCRDRREIRSTPGTEPDKSGRTIVRVHRAAVRTAAYHRSTGGCSTRPAGRDRRTQRPGADPLRRLGTERPGQRFLSRPSPEDPSEDRPGDHPWRSLGERSLLLVRQGQIAASPLRDWRRQIPSHYFSPS